MTKTIQPTKWQKSLNFLRAFIGPAQLAFMTRACRGEEREWFIEKVNALAEMIEKMPKVYEQDGKGEKAIVYLHYFTAGADWYITEKDSEPEQYQAFGLADLYDDGGELGYIPIIEIIQHGELDIHFTPKTLEEIRKERSCRQ